MIDKRAVNEIEMYGGPKDGLRVPLRGLRCPAWFMVGGPSSPEGAHRYVLRPVQSRHGVVAYEWSPA